MISFSELKRAGFKKAGVWALDEKDEPYLKGSQSSVETGVYLFVTGGKVKYVGRADRLHTRLGSYSRAIRAAKKTRAVHDGIQEALRDGIAVDIYILDLTERFIKDRRGLPLDRLAGLESGLIEDQDPLWNPFNSAARKRRAAASAAP
jgi:hypothetical protein